MVTAALLCTLAVVFVWISPPRTHDPHTPHHLLSFRFPLEARAVGDGRKQHKQHARLGGMASKATITELASKLGPLMRRAKVDGVWQKVRNARVRRDEPSSHR